MASKLTKKLNFEKITEEIKKNPIKWIENNDLNTITKTIQYFDDKYYNDTPVITDELYDYLIKAATKKGWIKKTVGAPIDSMMDLPINDTSDLIELRSDLTGDLTSGKVPLPFFVGSMDKFEPGDKSLLNFIKKYPEIIISEKLDGISFLLDYRSSPPKAYTRGNGYIGKDVSWLISGLIKNKKIPKTLEMSGLVRCEILISRENWEKNKSMGKNARNTVAGLVNRKGEIDSKLYQILDVVAYEYIDGENISVYSPFENQLDLLEKLGFKVVKNFKHNFNKKSLDEISDYLSELVKMWKTESEYEIDGIILSEPFETFIRSEDSNPEYSKAFKINIEGVETVITGIEWNPSRDGTLVPVILVEPIDVGGVSISRVSGDHAKYIVDNGIGMGASVLVVRSKDVIPRISGILVPVEPELPSDFEWEWDSNKVTIKLKNPYDNQVVKVEIIKYFMEILEIEFFKGATIDKCVKNGFDTIPKILNMTIAQISDLERVGEKSATKMHKSLQEKYIKASDSQIIASAPFTVGFGVKKVKKLIESIPDLFERLKSDSFKTKIKQRELYVQILGIEGFGEISAINFINQMERNIDYFNELPPREKSKGDKTPKGDLAKGLVVLFSGVRDKDVQKWIEDNCGEVKSSMSSKVNILIVKNKNDITEKIKEAKEKGIKIMELNEFKEKYI
jgi:DNA ligase (NAD+)